MNPYLQEQVKNPTKFLNNLCDRECSYWTKRGEKMALKLFKDMSQRVPAYKKFLKENKINPNKIKTFEDVSRIPTVSKDNYLKKYSLEDLCWDGNFDKSSWVISSTSGSTGDPFYFPRTKEQDLLYSLTAELYLITNFSINKKSTLYIDAFPMGPWIGGLFTYQAIQHIADRSKYNLSIITTSIDKNEILKAIQRFGDMFDQIILGSYGPFTKDVLEEGSNRGINWKKYDIKFVFSAEAFSETFRDYVLETVGKAGAFECTLNHYGTVDLGTMAYETPLAIKIRRLALNNKNFYYKLFGDTKKLPTLCQYLPEHFYFQKNEKGGLICSSYSGIPLFRYDLKDNGDVISFEEMKTIFKGNNLDFADIRKDKHIPEHSFWEIPFVFVFERGDLSVSFYAFQVYPEAIRIVLLSKDMVHRVTGKFTMIVDFDSKMNQKLNIHIELSEIENSSTELIDVLRKRITESLIENNSEYRKTYKEKGKLIEPVIVLHKYEDLEHFKPGIKQKWCKDK